MVCRATFIFMTRSLPGQDSNLDYQSQNLVCYRLHHQVFPADVLWAVLLRRSAPQ